jgi:hypothetical protein
LHNTNTVTDITAVHIDKTAANNRTYLSGTKDGRMKSENACYPNGAESVVFQFAIQKYIDKDVR